MFIFIQDFAAEISKQKIPMEEKQRVVWPGDK